MDEDGERGLQGRDGKLGAGLLAQDLRDRQPGIPCSSSATASRVVRWILRGSLTIGLPKPVGEIGGQRQQGVGLVGIGDQVDDDLHVLLQAVGIEFAGGKQRERIGIVGGNR